MVARRVLAQGREGQPTSWELVVLMDILSVGHRWASLATLELGDMQKLKC